MAEINQFGSTGPQTTADAKACAQFEAMLADALDEVLTPDQQVVFDQHARECGGCGVQLADARQGAAWLTELKAFPPEPDASLVPKILAQTSLAAAMEVPTVPSRQEFVDGDSLLSAMGRGPIAVRPRIDGAGMSAQHRLAAWVRPITQTVLQPRFMMTAAMAFFSIALTLNVTGVHLSQMRASDLKPSSLRRSFYQANAHVVRYYDNLRVVYELESRVHDLQRSTGDANPAQAFPSTPMEPKQKEPQDVTPGQGKPTNQGPDGAKTQRPDPKAGSSRREMPVAPLVLAGLDGTGEPMRGVNVGVRVDRWESASVLRAERVL